MNASSELARTSFAAAADRGAEGRERGAAGDDRDERSAAPAPVDRDEQREPGEHQQRHRDRGDDPEQQLLAEQAGAADQRRG